MGLTLEEASQRAIAAKKARKENGVLVQWYQCLAAALKKSGGTEPDFGFRDFRDASWIIDYRQDFVQSVIGDQLKEYGLELVTVPVVVGFETAERVYIGKPGWFDQYLS